MSDPRDGWDRFDILAKAFAAIGLPVIIGILGFCHNQREKDASRRELALRDSIAAQERQADRLAGFIEHLSNESPRRRLIAIRVAEQLSLRNQLPGEVGPLLIELAEGGADSAERRAAQKTVALVAGGDARRNELFQRLFADDPRDRVPASEELVRSSERDTAMVPALLEFASQHLDNANGVFNTLGILVQICPRGTRQHQPQIDAFVERVRRSATRGPRIQALIDQLTSCR